MAFGFTPLSTFCFCHSTREMIMVMNGYELWVFSDIQRWFWSGMDCSFSNCFSIVEVNPSPFRLLPWI